jgi:O-glycosyl hydrolase
MESTDFLKCFVRGLEFFILTSLYCKFYKTLLAQAQIQIYVNESNKFQNIIGFGGAFTDAAGINIQQLSSAAQKNLLGSYYGPGR